MTTVNELKMLRMKVLSSHPWAQANIGRVVSRIRREFGVETWEAVTATMQQVKITKDIALWQATLDPLIAKLQKAKILPDYLLSLTLLNVLKGCNHARSLCP